MGFIREKYSNNQGGLTVIFMGDQNTETYFAGDSVQDALNYFDMYIKNNQIYVKTEEELALQTIGVKTEIEATELRNTINTIVASYSDEAAIENKILFPYWIANTEYLINDRIRYGNRLYKVLQSHTSQEDWTPTKTPSLYAPILTSEDTSEPQEWIQPDSTNPYMYGDRVIYNNKIYESTIDFNVWNPENYTQGWTLIEDLNPTPETEIEEWTQSKIYQIGDRVTYNGSIYESVIANNVWDPVSYPTGWILVE